MSNRFASSYRPTASMIHELRMIAQSFFQHRTNETFWKRSKPEPSPLICVPCARLGSNSRKAIAISGGQSVCRLHLD